MSLDNEITMQNLVMDCCKGCWLADFIVNDAGANSVDVNRFVALENAEFNKGENLVKSGESALGVYCIKRGKVKAYLNGRKNRQFILRMVGKGELIGLSSMMNNDTYNCSSVALEPVSACFIKMLDLKKIIQQEPGVREKILKDLHGRLRLMEQRIVSISKRNITEQFAELLVSGADTSRVCETEKNYSKYSLTDIASILGTNRNYLYKVIAELTDKQILSMEKRKIVINDIQSLSRIAKGSGRFTQR